MNVNIENIYEALYFFETLSACYSCRYRDTGCTEPALAKEDGMCHMKQQALQIIWDTMKQQICISLPD